VIEAHDYLRITIGYSEEEKVKVYDVYDYYSTYFCDFFNLLSDTLFLSILLGEKEKETASWSSSIL